MCWPSNPKKSNIYYWTLWRTGWSYGSPPSSSAQLTALGLSPRFRHGSGLRCLGGQQAAAIFPLLAQLYNQVLCSNGHRFPPVEALPEGADWSRPSFDQDLRQLYSVNFPTPPAKLSRQGFDHFHCRDGWPNPAQLLYWQLRIIKFRST